MADIEEVPALEKGDGVVPPLAFGETGYVGLNVLGGDVLEECSHELRWPEAIHTYKKMAKDAAISPALELVEMMISRVPWSVRIPEGYEEELKDKANFLRQCMGDMEHDWGSFIKQAATFHRYGFAPVEKVYGYRLKSEGSKFDDGLVRIRKLPLRAQDSIEGWKWTNNNRTLAGLNQSVITSTESTNGWDFVNSYSEKKVVKFIPRKKFLLFRNNALKDSPVGTSPLNGAWQAWKFKQALDTLTH